LEKTVTGKNQVKNKPAGNEYNTQDEVSKSFLRHSIVSCVTKPYGFELLTLPNVALFFD